MGKEPVCQSEEFEATRHTNVQANAAALAEGTRKYVVQHTGWQASGYFDSQLNPNQAMQNLSFQRTATG
jgi:hypothetical protein